MDRAPLEDTIAQLEATVAKLGPIVARAEDELKFHQDTLRRAERALTVLRGEPLRQPTVGPNAPTKTKARGTGVGTDRLDQIRTLIQEFVVDHDEFRQVDIRSMPGVDSWSSSQTATAFDLLRQEGFIRLARQSGNNKYFRLTRQALGNTNGDGEMNDDEITDGIE